MKFCLQQMQFKTAWSLLLYHISMHQTKSLFTNFRKQSAEHASKDRVFFEK